MILLLTFLWPGLAGAVALGLGAGRLSGLPRGAVAPAILTVAVAVLWGAALSGVVPGRAGLWVESAALMLPAYLAGCLAGALVGRISRRKPEPAAVGG
ncbi:hypothetical protein [Methylobacterium sp. sgz302541]|uniref:hypothetical protein n=1 Tax=unclassified Methylobacterium TaxID=2615210 RepID=UPI003D35145F